MKSNLTRVFQQFVCHSGEFQNETFYEILFLLNFNFSYRLNQNTFVYAQVETAGWGKTSFGGPVSTSLKKVTLNVIPNSECNNSYPFQLSEAQLCTFTPFKDTCDVSSIYIFFYLTIIV